MFAVAPALFRGNRFTTMPHRENGFAVRKCSPLRERALNASPCSRPAIGPAQKTSPFLFHRFLTLFSGWKPSRRCLSSVSWHTHLPRSVLVLFVWALSRPFDVVFYFCFVFSCKLTALCHWVRNVERHISPHAIGCRCGVGSVIRNAPQVRVRGLPDIDAREPESIVWPVAKWCSIPVASCALFSRTRSMMHANCSLVEHPM